MTSGQEKERTRVAMHEAAHVVVATVLGTGAAKEGIDLNAESSVRGAYGNAAVQKYLITDADDLDTQKNLLVRNVAMMLAGPACDARTLGRSLDEAMAKQPGDVATAKSEIARLPAARGMSVEQIDTMTGMVMDAALETAVSVLSKPTHWATVERVAQASLANNGILSQEQIQDLVNG